MLQDFLDKYYGEALLKGINQGLAEGLKQGEEKEKKRLAGLLRRKEFSIKDISDITGLSYETIEEIGEGKYFCELLIEENYNESFEDGLKQGLAKGLLKGAEEERNRIEKELSARGFSFDLTDFLE